jgi:adenylate cyclase
LRKKLKWITLALNTAIVAAMFFVLSGHALDRFDKYLYDFNMKRAANHTPHDRVVVVAIDDNSLENLGQFPWDRSYYAHFLDMINQPGNEPKAIAFDILLNDESDPESDAVLAEALARYPNVILPTVGITESEVSGTLSGNRHAYPQAYRMDAPLEIFSEHTHVAHINRLSDEDGVIRKIWLKLQDPDGNVYNTLAFEAVKMYGADLTKFENIVMPGQFKDTINISYQGEKNDFTTISFFDIFNGELLESDFLKDAIVFVGFTASGLSEGNSQDTGTTPIEKVVKLVYVHANVANQLLNGLTVTEAPAWAGWLMVILLLAFFIWLPWGVKNVYSILVFLAAIAALLAGQFYYFQMFSQHFPVVYGLMGMSLVYIANVSLKAYSESWQKNFVTRQFGRYISPDLVKQIVEQNIDIKLGGDSKNITIMFLDIRGFTPLSEKLTPPELVDTLNTMFNMITETVLRNRGTIDKFIGDAAMMLFNAPLDLENHPVLAVKTAYEIQQQMKGIRDQILDKYGVEVNVGIGIHTGNVVVGNIGSYLRVDYTAIGDTVNTAARIESQTKKGQIHVSQQVYELTVQYFEFDEGEDRMFKGKSHPIRVYEVLGVRDPAGLAALEAAASREK